MVGQVSRIGSRAKRIAAVAAIAGLVVALGACSSDDDGDDDAATEQADDTAADDTAADGGTDDGDDNGGLLGSEELEEAEARAEAAEAELETTNATLAETQASLTAAEETNAALTAQLATETARADEAEGTLNNIGAQFPVTISSALTPEFDPIGSYMMTFAEAYCEGAQICGTPPSPVEVRIVQGPVGLVLEVPGLFDAGLLGVSGELVAGSDSNTIVTCGGQPVTTRVLTTLFGEGVIIDIEGNRTLSGLAASVFVQAAATEACPAVSVFYGAELIPV